MPCSSLNHRAKYTRRLATIHEAAIFRGVMCLMLVLLRIALQAQLRLFRGAILRNAEPQVVLSEIVYILIWPSSIARSSSIFVNIASASRRSWRPPSSHRSIT